MSDFFVVLFRISRTNKRELFIFYFCIVENCEYYIEDCDTSRRYFITLKNFLIKEISIFFFVVNNQL